MEKRKRREKKILKNPVITREREKREKREKDIIQKIKMLKKPDI